MSKLPKAMPSLLNASTTFRLNPHLGASGEPFMNTITGCWLASAASCCCCSGVNGPGWAEEAAAGTGYQHRPQVHQQYITTAVKTSALLQLHAHHGKHGSVSLPGMKK
jgi:hypothetical protein